MLQTAMYHQYKEEKAHGQAVWPYQTYLCTIPLDFACVPIHWHEEMEIVYIKKGCGTVLVDLQAYPVSAGSIVLIAPGKLHSIEGENNTRMEYENILFAVNMLNGLATDWCTLQCFLPLQAGEATLPVHITPKDAIYLQIAHALDDADRACAQKAFGWQLAVKSALYQLFFALLSNQVFTHAPLQNNSIDKIKLALSYIETHYSEQICVQDMAKLCCFSVSHFMRFFKNTMGTPFIAYLNDYRLNMAAQMLLQTDDTISNIATNTGFDNLSYFNRMFRKKYTFTPSQFRKIK